MTEVAAASPHAWFPTARSPEEIVTVTADNRMVAYPYTKLMTAIMDVDMAAGLLLASAAKADALGVPEEKRVYLRGWGYDEDPDHVAEPPPWSPRRSPPWVAPPSASTTWRTSTSIRASRAPSASRSTRSACPRTTSGA